jgi:hypothetical protein
MEKGPEPVSSKSMSECLEEEMKRIRGFLGLSLASYAVANQLFGGHAASIFRVEVGIHGDVSTQQTVNSAPRCENLDFPSECPI